MRGTTLRTPGRVMVVLAAFASTGCFGFAPAQSGAVPPGSQVRVHLTRAGLLDLPEIPVSTGPTLIGTLRAQDERVTVLFVTRGVVVEGAIQRVIGQEVSVSSAEIIQMEQRQFKSGRTALTVAGGLAVLAILAASVRGTRAPVELPPGPGPQESRLPVSVSIPIGR